MARSGSLTRTGKLLLSERAGGRTFKPTTIEGTPYLGIRQRFEPNADEGLYGTGMHQQGWMDLKGRDVELLQHNIDKPIPYLASSRHYGILWDNNSITRLGDPRGLQAAAGITGAVRRGRQAGRVDGNLFDQRKTSTEAPRAGGELPVPQGL